MKKYSVLPLLFLAPFVSAEPAVPEPDNETIHCVQQEVISGDSLMCRTADGQESLLQLAYIKAPKLKQGYGEEAKQALSNLLSGNSEYGRYGGGQQIEVVQRDKGGKHILVLLKIPMGNAHLIGGGEKTMWGAVNYAMIEKGYAWHVPIRDKDKENAAYAFSEKYAKADKKGIWSRPNLLWPRKK